MGLFSIFNKTKKRDNTSHDVATSKAQSVVLTDEEIKLKAEKDLAKLTSFDNKIQKKEKKRITEIVSTKVKERPEETRAREALSISNPFRGI